MWQFWSCSDVAPSSWVMPVVFYPLEQSWLGPLLRHASAQPCYKWWEIPYYWAGLKAYDLVAGTQGLTLSRFSSAAEAHRQFPTLAERGPNGDSLKGAVCTLRPSELAFFWLCLPLVCACSWRASAALMLHSCRVSLEMS